jgi:hypothetical protein
VQYNFLYILIMPLSDPCSSRLGEHKKNHHVLVVRSNYGKMPSA